MRKTKTSYGWFELDTDALDWIDMVLAKCIEGRTCIRHLKRNMMRPVIKKARDWGNRILGISLLDVNPKLEGTRNWLLPNNWRERLERAGVDPDTLEIVSPHLWETTLARLDIEDYRKNQKAVGEFLEPKQRYIERMSDDLSPVLPVVNRNSQKQVSEQALEPGGFSFGAPVRPSTPEFFSQKKITSGPTHKPWRPTW